MRQFGRTTKTCCSINQWWIETKVYWVSTNGYDTHNSQVSLGNTTSGGHSGTLTELSNAIKDFMDDIKAKGLEERVLGLAFSEFGRTIKSNGNLGTDHGVAGPMFLFGKHINPGIFGINPLIPAPGTINPVVSMQYDYRLVYQSILQSWFCILKK
ncbi:MAG: DUF1501 domain-containing protein [Saprospiraceae bacterium]|nr:DUF1501 domain-containing protein [Saprospiraceae bacterium]